MKLWINLRLTKTLPYYRVIIYSSSINNEESVNTDRERIRETIQEQSIDWKSALELVLSKPSKEIADERTWAVFLQDLRDLCPETKWFSHCESTTEVGGTVASIRDWFRTYIMSSDWPFPEQAFIHLNSENEWALLFLDSTEELALPKPSQNLSITTWTDEHSTGFRIKVTRKQ